MQLEAFLSYMTLNNQLYTEILRHQISYSIRSSMQKLSDFGLAEAGPTGDHSHVSTQVLGTQGYTAPEYIATDRLTARCDSAMVLLELLSSPGCSRIILTIAWGLCYWNCFQDTLLLIEQKLVRMFPPW